MAERISPESSDFRGRWRRKYLWGFMPWISYQKNPYLEAFYRRYEWVSSFANGLHVLDIPCGMGWGTSMIKNAGRITAVDIDDASIQEARRRYGNHAEFIVAGMEKIPVKDGSIDVVACLEGIEHVPIEIAIAFLNEAARVLKHKGKLLMTSPHTEDGSHSGNEFHLHEYQTEELRSKLEPIFYVNKVTSYRVDKLIVDYLECTLNS